jgi:hypothetical protein
MLTLKRLYLYSVLGVALVLLLRGLTDLTRLGFERLGDALGARSYIGEEFLRADLSWALALVIVATPIWVVHLWLVRRTLRGPAAAVTDEQGSWTVRKRAPSPATFRVAAATVLGMSQSLRSAKTA